TMSGMKINHLRALTVQRLAGAYNTDEIAASVMVVQGTCTLDDIVEQVLRVGACYASHFRVRPCSQSILAESTTVHVLDKLIAAYPQRLEFYCTPGIVRCFRDQYQLATRDFTHALKEARNLRNAKHPHMKWKKAKTHGQAPPDGTAVAEGWIFIHACSPAGPSNII
ncbi:hypothetical protein JB92DRAFT_2723857, partial [Gautieria morchelliformis]